MDRILTGFPLNDRCFPAPEGALYVTLFGTEERLSQDEVDEGRRALEALVGISRSLAEASLDLPRICETLSGCVTQVLGDACGVHLLSEDGQWLRTVSVDHRDAAARESLRGIIADRYPAYSGPSGEVLRTGAAVFVPIADPTEISERVPAAYRDYARRFPIYSLSVLPICATSKIIGTLSAWRIEPRHPYTDANLQLLQELADRAGFAIGAAMKHEQLVFERSRLRAKTEELEAVMAAAPVAIWVSQDPLCHTITGNPESYRLINEEPGKNVSMSAPPGTPKAPYRMQRNGSEIPPAELPMQMAAGTGQPLRDVEFDLVLDDGNTRRMYGSALPLFADDGQPRGSVGAFLDVTPLRDAIRVRDDFVSMASHELKTPLTSVELNITSLLRSYKTGRAASMGTEEIERRLATTWRDIKRLATLINDLLDVSRISAGRLMLERSALDLRELATDLVAHFQDQAAAVDSPLIIDVPQPVLGHWDRNRLDQIITNLLSNALKYGRGKPIVIAAASSGDRATLSVTDQGIGIAAEDQTRVFQRFQRAVTAGYLEGMGLGLWIVKQLAEAHGGSIAVRSELGAGATFTLTLPSGAPDR